MNKVFRIRFHKFELEKLTNNVAIIEVIKSICLTIFAHYLPNSQDLLTLSFCSKSMAIGYKPTVQSHASFILF